MTGLNPTPADLLDVIKDLQRRVYDLERRSAFPGAAPADDSDLTLEWYDDEECQDATDPSLHYPCPRLRMRLGLLDESTGQYGLETVDYDAADWGGRNFRGNRGGTIDLQPLMAASLGVGPAFSTTSASFVVAATYRLPHLADGIQVPVHNVSPVGTDAEVRLVLQNGPGGVMETMEGIGSSTLTYTSGGSGDEVPYVLRGRIPAAGPWLGNPVVEVQTRRVLGAGTVTLRFNYPAQVLG